MTLKQNFLEKNQAAQEIDTLKWELHGRIRQAENDTAALEEEKIELKNKRPAMLADNEEISELNSRLKEIDDEIEICKDTILGINEKLKSTELRLRNAKVDADNAFEEMVKAEMDKLVPAYQKYAKKLADVILDYNALEGIYQNSGYIPAIRSKLETIPNLLDESEPFLERLGWDTANKMREKIRRKYNLTDFEPNTR